MVHSFAVYVPAGSPSGEPEPVISAPANITEHAGLIHGCRVFVSGDKRLVETVTSPDGFAVCIGGAYSRNDLVKQLLATEDQISLENLVSKTPGQYCAVVGSDKLPRPIAITDPSGLRSLYCLKLPHGLLLGSNVSILRLLAGDQIAVPNHIDEAFLFRYAYLPPGRTVYRDVEELGPQQFALLGPDGVQDKSPLPISCEIVANGDDPSDDLHDVLLECTRQQLGDRKRVGVLLGGFDSALVASLLCRLGADVETYSFHYAEEEFNQPLAEELSAYLDISHHWVEINAEIVQSGIQSYGDCCNSPTVWPNYVVQTQHLCRVMAEQGMECVFSGDGCDTAFLGYPSTFRRGTVYQRMPKLPRLLANGTAGTADAMGMEYLLGHTFRVAKSLLHASTVAVDQRPLRSFQVFDPHGYRRLTGKSFPAASESERVLDTLGEKINEMSYARKIYFGKSQISPNKNKLISSTDVSGLMIESPYLHPALKAFATSLPDEALRPSGKESLKEGKALLIHLAESRELLPPKIIFQPKLAAIKSPVDKWYAGRLRSFLMEMMKRLPFEANERYIRSLIDDLAAERFYKRYLSDDMVVSLAASLLATYASYFPVR